VHASGSAERGYSAENAPRFDGETSLRANIGRLYTLFLAAGLLFEVVGAAPTAYEGPDSVADAGARVGKGREYS